MNPLPIILGIKHYVPSFLIFNPSAPMLDNLVRTTYLGNSKLNPSTHSDLHRVFRPPRDVQDELQIFGSLFFAENGTYLAQNYQIGSRSKTRFIPGSSNSSRCSIFLIFNISFNKFNRFFLL